MERAAHEYFQRIDELGGVIPAIERVSSRQRSPMPPIAIRREIDEGRAGSLASSPTRRTNP